MYPYALSKYLGEQAAMHWQQVYRLPVVSIRIFNAFGTRAKTSSNYGAVFGVFLKQKLAGKPFTLVGDGSQTRDFLYVTDVVRAFYLAAQLAKSGSIYNLGAGKPQSIAYLIKCLGGGNIVHLAWRPGEPKCTYADITKITHELGFKPQITFEQGVNNMLANIEFWQAAPLWNKTTIANATKTWFNMLTTIED